MHKNRKAQYSGKFYDADPTALIHTLNKYFSLAKPASVPNVLAIVSPHAGYVFSGQTAASAFNQINTDKTYDNIFFIAPSHHFYGNGIALFNGGNYETPLGELPVNFELQTKLLQEYPELFYEHSEAHYKEHSLEVQLPFVQYRIKHYEHIVPLIVTTHNIEQIRKIAQVLQPYFNEQNLFVISTDWSHYPCHDDALMVDKETIDAVISKDIDKLLSLLDDTDDIDNLHTRMCGSNAVILLMLLAQSNEYQFHLIEYTNSSYSPYGDTDRVVGYAAIAVSKSNEQSFYFSENEKNELLIISRQTLENYLKNGDIPSFETNFENLKKNYGAFVSLYHKEQLRGCLGKFTSNKPLYQTVQELTIASATKDFRFNPIEIDELADVKIEISVLSQLKKISDISEIILGKHGIYIKKGYHSGTFLPQVATKTGWSVEEFLGHCARDKAGIGWNGWKDAEVFVYEALIIKEA